MERSTSSKKAKLTPKEWDIIELILTGAVDQAIADKLDISPKAVKTRVKGIDKKIRGAYQEVELKEGGESSTGKEQQSDNTPPKERALRFANDEAYLKAVRQLWRKQPFELGGVGRSLIVPDNVANDLLNNFTEEEVNEIELINLADLPPQEAVRRYAARFQEIACLVVWTDFVEPRVRITVIFPLLTPEAFLYADGVIDKLEDDFGGTTRSRLPKFPSEPSPFVGTYRTRRGSRAVNIEQAEILVIMVDAALNDDEKTDFLRSPITVNSKDALVLYLKTLKEMENEC